MGIGVKPQRRRKVQPPPPGKETHQIVAPDGSILRNSPYGEGATLAVAQRLAQIDYDDEVELIVRVKTLFGDPDPLFRVVREEDGSVSTYRIPIDHAR